MPEWALSTLFYFITFLPTESELCRHWHTPAPRALLTKVDTPKYPYYSRGKNSPKWEIK